MPEVSSINRGRERCEAKWWSCVRVDKTNDQWYNNNKCYNKKDEEEEEKENVEQNH